MNELEIRNKIIDILRAVRPWDAIEKGHQEDILDWIASGAEIFRIKKPATPLKHLVCYSVLVDLEEKKILLFDHKKALLLLPSGGHVDKNEVPFDAAKRELIEELNIQPRVLWVENEVPFFVTIMETVGNTPGHFDVDLWYVFERDSKLPINDKREEFKREFYGYHWLGFDEILSMPKDKLDSNMHRFVKKLQQILN